jgi:hypothetical protein
MPEIAAGPIRQELATAIRSVNAALAQVGDPDLPELRSEWLRLDRALSMATLTGDHEAARIAVNAYRRRSLALIAEAGR